MDATLTPEQIKSWRTVIMIQLDAKIPGAGSYALIMPEYEVIAYAKAMKEFLEKPREPQKIVPSKPKRCGHSNHIIGSKGKYCIDCEKYV
jgi:hypothetical protein